MSNQKKILKIITVNFILIIFVLLISELYLKNESNKWLDAQSIGVIRNRSVVYSTNFYEVEGSIIYNRDEYGLRDDCDPEEINILTIGGSTTDQRYIEFNETFQEILEYNLSENLNRKICVSNAGVDGHSTYAHLISFDSWFPIIDQLNPDIYLLYVGINDAFFIGDEKNPEILNKTQKENSQPFLKELEIYAMYQRILKLIKGDFVAREFAGHNSIELSEDKYTVNKLNPKTPKLSLENAENFRIRLKQILDKVDDLEGDFLCITQPHRFVKYLGDEKYGIENIFSKEDIVFSGLDYDYALNEINTVIFEECGKNNLIDLYSYDFKDKHFYDYAHTTPAGSEIIGNQIFFKIMELPIYQSLKNED